MLVSFYLCFVSSSSKRKRLNIIFYIKSHSKSYFITNKKKKNSNNSMQKSFLLFHNFYLLLIIAITTILLLIISSPSSISAQTACTPTNRHFVYGNVTRTTAIFQLGASLFTHCETILFENIDIISSQASSYFYMPLIRDKQSLTSHLEK